MKQTTVIFLFIAYLIFGSAIAQNQPPLQTPPTFQNPPGIGQMPAQNQMNPIVGVWQTTIALGQGLPEATGILYAFPNNMYREEMYINKELGAFWEGKYTLTPDGTFTQFEGNKSPQICIAKSQCMTNESESQIVSRISLKNPNEMTINIQDSTSGQMIALNYSRMQNPNTGGNSPTTGGPTTSNMPTLPNPNMPGGTVPNNPSTTGNLPTNTSTGAQVAANTFSSWIGSYTDGELTVHLGSPQGNYMQKGDATFQLAVQGDAQRLEGAFRTQSGDTFPIVLERQNGLVIVTSDTLNFSLNPMTPPQPAAPVNPLGN